MKFPTKFQWLFLALALHATLVCAGSSFGGVNHYYLASLPATQRDQVVRQIVQGGARVIRFFVGARPYPSEKKNPIATSPDVESPIGNFNNLAAVLEKYDDLMYSIYTQSGGHTKVLLSLHNANNLLSASSDLTCDAYCQALHQSNRAWQRFYLDDDMKGALQNRYKQILNNYQSKNWPGKTWSQLSQVIMAIDLENEPLVSDGSSSFGSWICDIATFLKQNVGLQGIGVASGGLRGSDNNGDRPPSPSGPNWPDDAFTCRALDIISFHGYYTATGTCATCGADQPWYDKLIQQPWGGVLRQKALANGKLLMAEEWAYSNNQLDINRQIGEIWAQGHALNVRGIPWTYWDVMSGPDGYCDSDGCKEVSVDGQGGSPWAALSSVMTEAYNSQTEFDWSRFFPPNPSANLLVVPANAQSVSNGDGSCTWGCVGWSCSANQPCSGDNECVSGVCKACSWGCKGWSCSATQPCQGDNECINGVCNACKWGCKGWQCGVHAPCKDANECSSGVCQTCSWGCLGWNCNANSPCQGQLECTNGVCSSCSWGCLGWGCTATSPCKTVNQCSGNTCTACNWGCPGWTCSASQPCQGDGECTNSQCKQCTWGCLGWACSAASPCKGQNECVSGACKPCSWGCLGWPCNNATPCKPGYVCNSGVCKSTAIGHGTSVQDVADSYTLTLAYH